MIIGREDMTYEEFLGSIHDIILTEEGNCPVNSMLQMLQGKWKFPIIYELCIKEPLRYGELKRMIPGITSTMLSSSLKEMESDGLVSRTQYEGVPVRVEYSLTPKGRDMLPVFYEMMRWGIRHIP